MTTSPQSPLTVPTTPPLGSGLAEQGRLLIQNRPQALNDRIKAAGG